MPEPTHSEKIKAGQKRAARLGRKVGAPPKATDAQIKAAIPLGTAKGAAACGLSRPQFMRRRRIIEEEAEA